MVGLGLGIGRLGNPQPRVPDWELGNWEKPILNPNVGPKPQYWPQPPIFGFGLINGPWSFGCLNLYSRRQFQASRVLICVNVINVRLLGLGF